MRRNLLINFLLLLFYALSLFASPLEIKSLRVFASGDETSFPLIDRINNPDKKIVIDFDVENDQYPTLMIIFKFCDADWNAYDNAFLTNPLYNKQTNLFFDRLPLRISGAQYHYSDSFPNNRVDFPFSGKWMFFIIDSHDPNMVYGSGKFFVISAKMNVNVQVTKESMQGNFGDNSNLGRTISIKTNFTLFDSLYSSNITKVEIIKNRVIDYPIVVDRFTNSSSRYYEWDGTKRFSFIARQLRPGNNYRQTDTRNKDKYNTPNVDAKFGEIDISDFYSRRGKDNHGASVLMNWRNEYADYHNVVFKLRSPEDLTKPIFIVGSFSNWKIDLENEMYDDNGMMNISIPLKRGIYDYQYVSADVNKNKIENEDWDILEGNFYETDNEYYVFVYYKNPELGGYDQIIGYKKITTGAL